MDKDGEMLLDAEGDAVEVVDSQLVDVVLKDLIEVVVIIDEIDPILDSDTEREPVLVNEDVGHALIDCVTVTVTELSAREVPMEEGVTVRDGPLEALTVCELLPVAEEDKVPLNEPDTVIVLECAVVGEN